MTTTSSIVPQESVDPRRNVAAPTPVPAQDASGLLYGEVSLTVQSGYARALIEGRAASADKTAIFGLLGFAERLRVIWQAARADDPYADWWLLRIEAALEEAQNSVGVAQSDFQGIFGQHAALEIQVATSVRPYRVSLRFANPYAYRTANLIGEFDRIACTLLTARQVGLIDRDTTHQTLQAASKRIRSVLAVPQGYRRLAIDRDLLQTDPEMAKAAAQGMGALPPEVLSGERLPALTPRNRPQKVAAPKSTIDLRPGEGG